MTHDHHHEPIPTKLLLGIVICLFAYLFFITVSSVVWQLGDAIPLAQLLFFQNGICFLCILPATLRHGIKGIQSKNLGTHFMRDLFGVGSYYFYFLAIQHLNLIDATTLNYTAPFFVPIIWWIWMRQKVGGNVWWSIIIGFIGVAVILNPTHKAFELGFIYGVLAGISSAIAFSALRILNLQKEPLARILFYYFLTGILLTFPFTIVSWVTPTTTQWIYLLVIGLGTAIAQSLLTIAYKFGTASYLSPLGYSTVIYSALSTWLIFDQSLSLRSIIGTILIVIGGTITYLLKKKPESIAQTFKNPDAK